jgi:hypothetical protein
LILLLIHAMKGDMTNHQGAKIITRKELAELRYELPKSWRKAAGLLRGKRKALEAHVKQVRREWDRRAEEHDDRREHHHCVSGR